MLAMNTVSNAAGGGSSYLSAGARFHRDRTNIKDYPFADANFSYLAAYEYHADNSYLQLGAGICPHATATNDIDYVITPQANLFFTDRSWEAGVGVVGNFIADGNDTNEEWSDIYYQLLLGYELKVLGLPVSLDACYPFDSWDKLSDFAFKDVEFLAMIKLKF
jgi:hypothetical protein